MRKTKILAFALAVIMVFSMVSVFASAAYTPISTSALLSEVEDSAYNVIVDWNFDNLTTATGSYNHTNIPTGGYMATHTGGTGYKVTKSGFTFQNNGSGRFSGKNGALYVDSSIANANTYIDVCPTNSYVNPKNAAANATYVNAVFSDYAGKSFVVSMDIKLDFAPANTGSASIMSFAGVQSVFTKDNSTPQIFSFDKDSGRFYYVDGSAGSINKFFASDIYLSNTKYTNVTCAVDVLSNTYDLYADGVLVKADIQYLPDSNVANILGPSASLTTATTGEANNVVVANDSLSTAEQKANPMLLYVPSCLRLCQSASASFYVDNFRFYFDDECHETYNSANTVEGYDLTIADGVLGLNYYLNLQSDVLADENAKVVFTTPRGEVQEKLVKDVVAETNGSYKFTATVSSVEMAKDITMEIKSGEKVYKVFMNGVASDAYTYSVKDYAEKLLSDATYGKIAKAMLNYGAYAQDYFKFDTENLANANCGYTTELSAVNNDVSNVSITGDAPAGTKAALVLDSNTSIVIYDKDGNKIGEKKGINSLELDTEYTIELTGGTSVTVSVLAVGEKVLESNATSQSYKDLIKTLKLFSDASKELNP